jgi:hypothetical protein
MSGRYAFASCEFAGRMIEIDLRTRRVVGSLLLNRGLASPQDVKLSPDGRTLYTADQLNGGLWEINPSSFRLIGFLQTGAGAHGLYPSRYARVMYVSDRRAGPISVVSFRTRRIIRTWQLPLPARGRLGRRQHAVAERALQRGGLRDRHPHRASPGDDSGRRRPARTVRVAPARSLLARPYRDPAPRIGVSLPASRPAPAPGAVTGSAAAMAAGRNRNLR